MEDYNTYQAEAEQEGQSPERGSKSGRSYSHGSTVPEKGKHGIGGYVLTGVLCLLLGVALGGCTAAVAISNVRSAMAGEQGGGFASDGWDRIDGFFHDGFWPGEEDGGDRSESESRRDEEYQEPEKKEYIEREMPAFDGVAPAIADVANPVPDIVEHVSDGVVGINIYLDEYGEEYLSGYGSGFVVSSEGYIITNDHVIKGADRITVTFSDGDELDAELIGGDVSMDTAVLKVDRDGLTPLAIGDSDSIRVGEFSLAIGNPSGAELAGSATFGIISATSRSINVDGRTLDVIQTDAAINLGSSGGPLLNMDGEVIGITTAKNVYAGYDEYGNPVNAEGLSFAMPINSAMEVVEQLITKGRVIRPGLGINVVEITSVDAEYFEVPEGILIYSVTKNGPAHKAGIKVDDIVLEYDGTAAASTEDFVQYVKSLKEGDRIELKIWRNGDELTIEAELGDMNQMGSELVGNRVSELLE